MHRLTPLLLAAALAAAPAAAVDELTLAGSLESGACRDTFSGEAESTQSASLEYRHESEGLSARGYGRVAPSGGNCADDAFTFDAEVERRFGLPGGWYGLARLGAEQYATTGVYRHVGADGLVLFANETDGSPAHTALFGAGRCFGAGCADAAAGAAWRVEAGANLAPNDYRGDLGAQSGHAGLEWRRPLLGGEIEAELEFEGPSFGRLVTGQRVSWSRAVSERFDLFVGYRRRGGLDNYAPPFAPSIALDGREYLLGATDGAVSTLEVGFTARLQ